MMRRLALLLTALALVLVGCGSDDPDADEAQPNPDDTQFAEGLFDEIPRMPTSEEISERTERDGNVSQSYTIRGEPPEDVMAWYRDTLTADGDFTQVSPAEEIGPDTWRSGWEVEGRFLAISASPAPAAEGGERDQGQGVDVVTQYSLSLAPEGENPFEIREGEGGAEGDDTPGDNDPGDDTADDTGDDEG